MSSCCSFFQAEDGRRDWSVTGVQTCALPIWVEYGMGERCEDLVHVYPVLRKPTWSTSRGGVGGLSWFAVRCVVVTGQERPCRTRSWIRPASWLCWPAPEGCGPRHGV